MEILSQTDTSVFVAPLFTIDEIWKQPRFLGADEWIKKKWQTYVYIDINTQKMEYYSALFSLNNELKKQNLGQKGMGMVKATEVCGRCLYPKLQREERSEQSHGLEISS